MVKIKSILDKPNIVFGIVFAILLGVIALMSDINVVLFYANDSVSNIDKDSSEYSGFETDYISNFWLKNNYVNLNGAIRSLLNQHEMNDVIKMDNGQLTGTTEALSEDIVDAYSGNAAIFAKCLKRHDVDYLYVTLPHMADKYDNRMPAGIEDCTNKILDDLNIAMTEKGVDTLDIRDEMHLRNISSYDIFYKTDHHWTMRGGFLAYQILADYFESKYNINIDDKLTDIKSYSSYVYKDNFLGSNGKRTGKYFSGLDDFELIMPAFDNNIINADDNRNGSVSELMFNTEKLTQGNYFTRYSYDTALSGTCGNWNNPDAPVDMNVTVIGDSMAKAVFPYLALTFKNVRYIDDYDADAVYSVNNEYIDKYEPDIVISFYGMAPAMSESSYNFSEFE